MHTFIELDNNTNIACIQGYSDGGVSEAGSAGGFWVQVCSPDGPWQVVASSAFLLPRGATITDCELVASQRLAASVGLFIRDLGATAKRRRRKL